MYIYNFEKETTYKGFSHIVVKRMRHERDYIADLVVKDENGNVTAIQKDVVFDRNEINEDLPVTLHASEIACMCGDYPSIEWLKLSIQEYLRVRSIEFTEEQTKEELLSLISE